MVAFLGRTLWLVWCWLELSLLTLLLYLLSWLPKPLTGTYYHYLFRVWCSLFVRALGVDLRLHEKNVAPIPKQYILIANHPSALEDVGIPTLFNVYPLAKLGVRDWFVVGRINVAAGTLFVDRDDPDSRHAALDQLMEKLHQGKNVALFPEGGCKGGRIHTSFQSGAFDLALRTGGEMRISNFSLWQSAYAEWIFIDKYFPDVTEDDLGSCLATYRERKRRYGA